MRFEIYKDARGEWRWRLKSRNGQIVAHGEGYSRRIDCMHTIRQIRRINKTIIVDLEEEKKQEIIEEKIAMRQSKIMERLRKAKDVAKAALRQRLAKGKGGKAVAKKPATKAKAKAKKPARKKKK